MTLVGQYLGRYRVIRQIGQGGMGEVYLAEDAQVTRYVAIKVVRSEQVPYPDNNTIQEAIRLFQREMKTISQLDHSHILNIYDFGKETVTGGSIIYMVMPYRSEGSLTDWLAQRNSADLLSPQDVGCLLTQASSALQHAHDRNIIHQDVKPSNFLIRANAEHPTCPDLFLVDFGVAKIVTATSTASNSVRGTYTYMAPEQWSGAAVPATDQYALAIMAYQLLTGIVPFQGRPEQMMFQHLTILPKAPSMINPRLSSTLDTVLLRALAKKPEERFPSISAFTAAFRQALVHDFSTSTPVVNAYARIESMVLASQPQSVLTPFHGVPVSSPEKSGLSPLHYIVGLFLLAGIIIVTVFSFNYSSSKYMIATYTNARSTSAATRFPSTMASVAPTPTNTLVPTTIAYPSYNDAETAIKYYYVTESDFRGENIIQSFDSITYQQMTGPIAQPQFLVCAQYKFALVSSPDVTADTARHTFTFQYSNGIWSVIDMGNWNSC